MDLNFTAEEEAFRVKVADFFVRELPLGIAEKMKTGRRLSEAGWRRTGPKSMAALAGRLFSALSLSWKRRWRMRQCRYPLVSTCSRRF